MGICMFNVQMKGKRAQGTIFGLLFIILSIVVYTAEISGSMISFIMGLLACVAVILMVADFEEMFSRGMDFLAKYTMPIFLMHTLFAAPLRSVLLKVGLTNAVAHVVLGLGISFSPNVYITDCDHEYRDVDVPVIDQGIVQRGQKVSIGEGSYIGINAVIVGNVRIGRHCVVGANSVVTKDVPDYCVAVGSPAKVIKNMKN